MRAAFICHGSPTISAIISGPDRVAIMTEIKADLLPQIYPDHEPGSLYKIRTPRMLPSIAEVYRLMPKQGNTTRRKAQFILIWEEVKA